ncbi:MAG: DUF192 domain-containing protein [Bacillota bacterium]|nr:DUF192 domain-containing protein [Bacillota bacterium]
MELKKYFKEIVYLDTFYKNFKGLMLRKNIDENYCYILKTQGIHTFFMKFNIDVIYLDKNNNIIRIIEDMKPWEIGPLLKKCKYVLEFRNKEFIDKVKLNDKLELK